MVARGQTTARSAAETQLAEAKSALEDLRNSMTVMAEERDLARSKEEEYFLELEVRRRPGGEGQRAGLPRQRRCAHGYNRAPYATSW